MKKHLHIVGQYYHSCSETFNFAILSEIDGLGKIACYYKYCPECGVKLTKKIIQDQFKKFNKEV